MTTVEHRYQPRGAARDLLHSRAPELLVSGPAGTGKSRACLEKLFLACMSTDMVKCLLVRKTAASLTTSALVTFEEEVAKEALAAGAVKYFGGSRRTPPQYQFPKTGSVINIGGLDNPAKVMSTAYDIAFVQEAIELTIDDWEAVSSRLRNGRLSFQQLLADTNPSMPTHWLKERCNRGDCQLLESRHEDNPRLFDGAGTPTGYGLDYIARLDRLTGVRYQRLRKGLWVAAEGMIYEDFDPAVHLIPRFEIPVEWPRFWDWDFGFTNPTSVQCWAKDPDGRLYMYRQWYRTRRTVDQHCADILSVVRPGGVGSPWVEPQPRAIVCDHDADGREVLARELGIGTIPADKRVTVGIEAMQRRLRPAGDGRPRMFYFQDALVSRDQDLVDGKLPTWTVEEIPGYVWAVKPGGALKEEPAKEHDHGCDGSRYQCAYHDLGSPRIRRM